MVLMRFDLMMINGRERLSAADAGDAAILHDVGGSESSNVASLDWTIVGADS